MAFAETIRSAREPLRKSALMPKIALRGNEGLKLKAIRLQGKDLGLEIGLLRLIDSGGNRVVGAFIELAHVTVPKMIEKWRLLGSGYRSATLHVRWVHDVIKISEAMANSRIVL
jgi:hypothetical protein